MDQSTIVKIMNYGALKYSPDDICKILGYTEEQTCEFKFLFADKVSEVRKAYDRGVLIGQYNIDAELAKQSEKGDILSIQELSERQETRQVDDLINNLFGI